MDTNNVATIIIRNAQGEYFAHQRSAQKKSFPNMYGLGAGGHIKAGESPAAAAKRELFEETGVVGDPLFLFAIPFEAYGSNYTVNVCEVEVNGEIHPDKHEWQWSGWLSGEEVDELLAQDKLAGETAVFYQKYKSMAGRK